MQPFARANLPIFSRGIGALDGLRRRLILLLGPRLGGKRVGARTAHAVLSRTELASAVSRAWHIGWGHIRSRRRHVRPVRVAYGILLIIRV